MDNVFDDWKKTLEDFRSSVEKELEEIRQHKAEVQQIKAQIFNELNSGRYIRDEQRIVISAPEVVIGNVDRSGGLLSQGGSTIILRANQIKEDGAGPTGSIVSRAASIRQIAADPGMDGNEAVVGDISEVVSQARSIIIQSNDDTDVFSTGPIGAGPGGVRIHADKRLELEAAQSSELKKKIIEDKIKGLEGSKSSLKAVVDKQKKEVEQHFKDMDKLIDSVDDLRATNEDVRSNMLDIQELNDQITQLSPVLFNAVCNYIQTISNLAETNRQVTALKAQKDKIVSGDDFKKKSTGASVSLRGEFINIASADGDGNLRDNEGAGINIAANKLTLAAREHDGQLKEKGELHINVKTIDVSTANTKMENDGKNGASTAVGDLIITSKTVSIEGVDYDIKDQKPEEKALTKDGKLSVRMEKTDISATDTEGKATGSISINSKALEVKAMDVDKEKRTDNKLAAGSTLLLLAEKMYVGSKDKDNKSKMLQAVSEELGLFADKTLEAQQDNGKAILQLAGGNAAVSGSKMEIYGATTIQGKTEVKDELKAPKATIDNLEAKTSFKSSNISDGIAIPGAPSSGSLSAKLKTEEVKS